MSRSSTAPSRAGRPVRASSRSASRAARRPALTPSHRSGSGSQRGERCPTHGSRVSPVSRPEHEVGQRAPREVARGDPVADVAAGPPGAGQRVPRHRRVPVARDAERAAPGVREPDAVELGEQVAQRRAQRVEDRRLLVELGPDRGAPVVRRAPAPEGDPPVVGALAVDDDVPVVREDLPAGEPDPGPAGVVDRLGGDHEGVHRGDEPAHPAQAPGPPLGGHHDGRRADPPAVTEHDDPVGGAHDASALDDPPAEPAHRGGEPVDEPARVHPGAVGGEGGSTRSADVEPLAGGDGIQPDRAVVPGGRPRGGRTGARLLRRRAGHHERAALDEAGRPGPRSSSTRPTSSTVSRRAASWARAAVRPWRRAVASGETGHSAETQPPLRPLAPKPTCSASSTSTSSPGRARSR